MEFHYTDLGLQSEHIMEDQFQTKYSQPYILRNQEAEYEVRSTVLVDGGDQYGVSASVFDKFEELVWMGNQGGHVTSYYGPNLQKYTSFQIHQTEEVRDILTLEKGIYCLTKTSLRHQIRRGIPQHTHKSSNMMDMQCLFQVNSHKFLIGGHQDKLLELDINKMTETVIKVPEDGCAVLRSGGGSLVACGSASGMVSLRDIRNPGKAEHTFRAHSACLSDLDMQGNHLITCGFTQSATVAVPEPYVLVWDVRRVKGKAAWSIPTVSPPLLLHFVPAVSGRAVALAGDGHVTLFHVNEAHESEYQSVFQVDTQTSQCSVMDVSSTSQALVFGDQSGHLHLFSAQHNHEPHFNNFSRATEFADPAPELPVVGFNDTTFQFSTVPLSPLASGSRWFNELPPDFFKKIYRKPKPIDPEVLKTMKMQGPIGYAPNPKTHRRNEMPYVEDNLDNVKKNDSSISIQPIPRHYLKVNVKTPVCAVSGAQFLTRKGFLDLRNTLDADVPFSLFRDEGRTFLQWSGEDEMRTRMSGRVMVVRLLCRDISATPISPLDLRGVFTPCVAFRVQGTPPRHSSNITEVQFAPNAQTSDGSGSSGLSVTEYIVIGISSLLLGLIYVASVFLYLHIKKRRKASAEEGNLKKLKGLKKDVLAITEHDIIRISNERGQTLPNSMGQDEGIVKKNPLLTAGLGSRQFHDNKGFSSDLSDSEDFADSSLHSEENSFNNQTISAVIHRHSKETRQQGDGYEISHRDESSIERLPDEHVSIVETIEDREIARPVGTTRRKLYFNPAYFEPHLMQDPPAAAIEFLSKIREVIAIAKQKMAAKRFNPVLNEIPEEETYPSNGNSINFYNGLDSQRSGSIVSLNRGNSRKKSSNCLGCPGCISNNRNSDIKNIIKYNSNNCSNCLGDKGDKQHSIQKWLENIPNVKQDLFYNDHSEPNHQNFANSYFSQTNNESTCKLHKHNSFCASFSTNLTDDVLPQRRTTRSVCSEPSLRNYNIPLPNFSGLDSSTNSCEIGSQKSERRNRNTLKNKNALPDMVNEAIALDNFSRSPYNLSSSDDEKLTQKIEEKVEDACSRNISDSPSGNEYETDSLERNSSQKRKTTPIEYPDLPSSQASPSLSNALPLEEELTMRNAIYKTNSSGNSLTPSPEGDICIDDDHYETIGINKPNLQNVSTTDLTQKPNNSYSLVTEVYVNNNYNFDSTPTSPSGSECSMGSRKLMALDNMEEKPGCLTIEVKDPPENYIRIHESDGFEPDTLDRKHPKHKEIIENIQFSRRELLQNIDNTEHKSQRIQLRSSGTFTKSNSKIESINKFNSLRNDNEFQRQIFNRTKLSSEIYSGSKSLEELTDDNWDNMSEEGRLLTLELRHSKRQRQSTPPTIKQLKSLARPDILPPLPPTEDNPIYEKPILPPRRVQCENIGAELNSIHCRSLSPRRCITSTAETDVCGNFSHGSLTSVPSCSPIRRPDHAQYAEYEDVNLIRKTQNETKVDKERNSLRTSSCRNVGINTNTFIRGQKSEHRTKFRRKKGSNIDDSGYLSSDSTSSKQVPRKLVIAKIASCSESDGTEDEARSESGAESIETHSVYFGDCQKQQNDEKNSIKMLSDSKKKVKVRSESNSQ